MSGPDRPGRSPSRSGTPQGSEAPGYESGSFEWRWTAHFEAFAASFDTVEGEPATPPGEYRFVVDGDRREGRAVKPYRVMSKSFLAGAWSGIKVEDLRRDPDGRVSFRVGPRSVRKLDKLTAEIGPIDFPDTYTYEKGGPLPRFIKNNLSGIRDPDAAEDSSKIEWFCTDCSFRPWIDFANATTATVTFVDPNGSTERVAATEENGRWRTARRLGRGEGAVVGRGCLQDGFDDFNGLQARTGSLAAGVDAACAAAGDLARLQLERGARRCGLPQGRLRGRILGRAGLSGSTPLVRRSRPEGHPVCSSMSPRGRGGSARSGWPDARLMRGRRAPSAGRAGVSRRL